MRYAIYFTPPPDDPLTRTAAAWLGRDAFTGQSVPHPQMGSLTKETIARITASPRRYGFHATLKAPFRLAHGRTESELVAAFSQFAAKAGALTVPEMVVGNLAGFFAIVPRAPDAALNALADSAVRAFEPFRAPLGAQEIARRDPERLLPGEVANLYAWGYPYVFESFRFHMTLTEKIPEAEQERVGDALQNVFGPVLPNPFPIDGLGLFVEPQPGAPFRVLRYAPLAPATG